MSINEEIASNLSVIEANICNACAKSGRDRSSVTLIAVSKTHPADVILEGYKLGLRSFGENKVQELSRKIEELPDSIQWHMIGHLQRNKVKYIAQKVTMIHSVDSLRLAETINKEAVEYDRVIPILIEVNMAGEESKFGVSPDETPGLIKSISGFPNISVKGLMTVAPNAPNPEDNRVVFSNLNKLSVDIANENIDNVTMNVLSMGMTGDYTIAIEEGATLVRIGTGLFGQRDYGHTLQ